MDLDSNGVIFAKSQVTDYTARGIVLEEYNVIQFFTDTYEAPFQKYDRDNAVENTDFPNVDNKKEKLIRGRPRNDRVCYLPSHPKSKQFIRIIRSSGHNNLPNIIGQQLPSNKNLDNYDFYCASVLMLLKPWRNISNLKLPEETWAEAFEKYTATASSEILDTISAINYLHESRASIQKDEETPENVRDSRNIDEDSENDDEGLDIIPFADNHQRSDDPDHTLEAIIQAQTSYEENLHGRFAIEIAKRRKIFQNDIEDDKWATQPGTEGIGNATAGDIEHLMLWRRQLETDLSRMNQHGITSESLDNGPSSGGTVNVLDASVNSNHPRVESYVDITSSDHSRDEGYPLADPTSLNEDQCRAYNIIVRHLDQTLSGKKPPPLRMLVHGEGGTGKSKLLHTVTEAFRQRGCLHRLLKAAYTGIAASQVDGKTIHTIAGISIKNGRYENNSMSEETKLKLERFWESYDYLAVDEMGMLAKDFFALLSRNTSVGKRSNGGLSFGGINVILLGDFHQFPPVARSIRDALYYPTNPQTDSVGSQVGRATYEEFTTVVVLKEQKRVIDHTWLEFLSHLRNGVIQDKDLKMLRTLIIGRRPENDVDFSKEPWSEAPLITPRHAVRNQWNAAATRKICKRLGQQLFICPSKDTYQNRELNHQEKCALEAHRGRKGARLNGSKDLPHQVELAIGTKVMVTDNVETDLDVTNGARGEIVGIVLHENEPPIDKAKAVVKLRYLPSYILVKFSRTRASRLDGLEAGVIPIEPITTTYRVRVNTNNGKESTRTFKRSQFPITLAYAFTDYRSQGQTLPYVIIDIASPPTGTLSLFNLYVALSRSSGRHSIRLLRDFEDKLFKREQDRELMSEDLRLETLNDESKRLYEASFCV